jgi:hypothetical protein
MAGWIFGRAATGGAISGLLDGWGRYDTIGADFDLCDGGGRSGGGEGGTAIWSECWRFAICEREIGRGGVGVAGIAEEQTAGIGEECGIAKTSLSEAADCLGAVAGREAIGQRDVGHFGWAFDGFGEALPGEWCGSSD